MGSHSKQKGAAFERLVCQKLSLWATRRTRDDVLWRSAMSGGRATVAGKKGGAVALSHVAGDVCAVHPRGYSFVKYFYVECKFYRRFDWNRLLRPQGPGMLGDFWRIAVHEAFAHNKNPLLVFKDNGSPIYAAMVAKDSSVFAEGVIDNQFIAHCIAPSMYVYLLEDLIRCPRAFDGL